MFATQKSAKSDDPGDTGLGLTFDTSMQEEFFFLDNLDKGTEENLGSKPEEANVSIGTERLQSRQKKLEELKLQEELGEVTAQEAVYQKVVNEESKVDDCQQPLLPTTPHDVISAFLNDNNAPEVTPASFGISPVKNVSVTFASPIPVCEPQSQPGSQAIHNISTPAAPVSIQEPWKNMCPTSNLNTATSFSFGGQVAPIFTVPSMDQSRNHPPKGFCGNPPAFVPSPPTVYHPTPQSYEGQLTDAPF
ncbi:hypothetical protein OS493_007149 [Desmophyllum pertusum]|uniref:Uncharacterized protein n=1 Tax=Desmophyllum pertusum TaxID=174260 RepID=A0A9X0CZ33_9CNID|nr:hypothetical protein OS493_007149 [Desmophyllum pertusum]